jgi:TetR/AcrR family transcriptional regulator, mexJK operon transcriptional repressor
LPVPSKRLRPQRVGIWLAIGGKSVKMNQPSPTPTNPLQHTASRKEAQILDAARRAFLECGFAETSMEAIARAANVSKATLYAYFPSKEALFSHLIETECAQKRNYLTAPSPEAGIEEALRALGGKFVSHFLTEGERSFFQAMSAERARFPELCRLFFNTGQKQVIDMVAVFLEECREKNLLAFDDSHLAATQFLHLVLTDLPMRVALGLDLPNEEGAARVMEAGVSTFLKAFQPKRGSKTRR